MGSCYARRRAMHFWKEMPSPSTPSAARVGLTCRKQKHPECRGVGDPRRCPSLFSGLHRRSKADEAKRKATVHLRYMNRVMPMRTTSCSASLSHVAYEASRSLSASSYSI